MKRDLFIFAPLGNILLYIMEYDIFQYNPLFGIQLYMEWQPQSFPPEMETIGLKDEMRSGWSRNTEWTRRCTLKTA